MREKMKPKKIAEARPAAAAVMPPVKIPKIPFSSIAFMTPFASMFPKPIMGTVAPAPNISLSLS